MSDNQAESTEKELTLEVIANFHQQLIRLDRAGLPVQIDEGHACANLPERLNEIMAGLASQINYANPLEKVLQQASFVTPRYRMALESWHKCDRAVESLSILRAPVQQDTESSFDLRFAMLMPLIVLALIYGAGIYLLQVIVPRMEAIYVQMNQAPGLFVQCLLVLRQTAVIWGPALPILVLVVAWAIGSGRWMIPRWMPGRKQATRYLAASLVAQNLSVQARQATSNATADWQHASADQSHASQALQYSPMLRWALGSGVSEGTAAESSSAQPRVRRLQMVASLYETMQAVRMQQFRGWLILVTSILIGGGLTFVYCLALFLPMIELLKRIIGR